MEKTKKSREHTLKQFWFKTTLYFITYTNACLFLVQPDRVLHLTEKSKEIKKNKLKTPPVRLDLAGASCHTQCHLSCVFPVNKEWVLLRMSSVVICVYFTFLVALFHVSTLCLCNTEKVKLFFCHSDDSFFRAIWNLNFTNSFF